jgi:hypothetical protein
MDHSSYTFKLNKVLYFIILILIIVFSTLYTIYLNKLVYANLPPRLQKFLNQYSDYYIVDIKLCKQELSDYFKNLFYYATLGNIQSKYETLGKYYHPYLILKLVDNIDNPTVTKYAIYEKLAVASIRILKPSELENRTVEYEFKKSETNSKPLKSDTICLGSIQGIPNLTVKEFLTKSYNELKEEFLEYDCSEKHCGWFIKRSIVDSNLIPKEERDAIINFLNIEKSQQYLKDYPKTANLINNLVKILTIREYLLKK